MMPRVRAFFAQPMGERVARKGTLEQLHKLATSLGAEHDFH
jgi:hypothetical protein